MQINEVVLQNEIHTKFKLINVYTYSPKYVQKSKKMIILSALCHQIGTFHCKTPCRLSSFVYKKNAIFSLSFFVVTWVIARYAFFKTEKVSDVWSILPLLRSDCENHPF